MNLGWKKVTWFSKLLALGIFFITLALAFMFGVAYKNVGQKPFVVKVNYEPILMEPKTAGWTTYKNDQYGFELQLPPNWSVEDATQGEKLYFISPDTKEYLAQNCSGEPGAGCIAEGLPFDIMFDNKAALLDGQAVTRRGTKALDGVIFTIFTDEEFFSLFYYEGSDRGRTYSFSYDMGNGHGLAEAILLTFKTANPSKEVFCTPDSREGEFCAKIYQPVCATVNIQCITTPCNPIKQTFGNACEACHNSLVPSYVPGECISIENQ